MKNETLKLFCSGVIQALEQNIVPWSIKMPQNAYTNKFYTGVNALVLNTVTIQRNYNAINLWATHKQWFKLNFNVIKKPENFHDDYGTKVVKVEEKIKAVDKGDIIQFEKYPNLEFFTLFHFNQVNGDFEYYNEFKNSSKRVCNLKFDKQTDLKKYLRTINSLSSELALTIAAGFINAELETGQIESISDEDLQKSKENSRFLLDAAIEAFKLIKLVYKQQNDFAHFTDDRI
jgi:hypothetical protein